MKIARLFKQAFLLWLHKEADQHAAALAYFTPFALTPLIIFSITIAGLIVGGDRVAGMLLRWATAVDPEVAKLLSQSVNNFRMAAEGESWPLFSFILVTLIIFVAFNSLALGLQKMWDIDAFGWRATARRFFNTGRTIIFLEIYLVAFVLLSSVYSTMTGVVPILGWEIVRTFLGFSCSVILLTMIYGSLPVRALSLEARFVGALVAAVLLLFTRELVGVHVAVSPTDTIFGAAGLLISLLVWVYVAAGAVFYGAVFAKVYTDSIKAERATRKLARGSRY